MALAGSNRKLLLGKGHFVKQLVGMRELLLGWGHFMEQLVDMRDIIFTFLE